MTKIRRYTIPSAAVLAVAAGVGLATAPAQAAMVAYNGCASTSFCTLTELLAGGYITVDEDGNGTIEKTFDNWMNYDFSKSPMANPLTDPLDKIRVSATGTYIPGVSGSATLNYTIVGGINLAPPSGNANWTAGISFEFDVTSAGYVPMTRQIDAITGASVTGPTTGTLSNVAFNGATLMGSNASATPSNPETDTMSFAPTNTLAIMNNLSLLARRTTAIPGTASVTTFSQTFTQVVIPEPGTVVGLLAVGGLGLAMKRKQQG
ncbi:PEP-CTERM sorting domain-containing protein [Microcystis aeruginosa CS-558/01A06]|uniref:PEP-CTERM sorting domain-containing protein n=1 Tax=Microcystis aeruginosa BLCC-F108 TaxID=2755317 RepID=A0A841UTB1_MICAE|nr:MULTISPECIES: PEP-CTERM sorting domain-containing protein [Microcystis]MBC1193185.1 PEP-CTERM sorting domain-containing protein [Microcystis aeruginosa BLCC-F108]MCA2593518.1 PEP-CTERM sorting domain-containing protein [Microcystis sp. M31BS1]MDB9410072.1 PEP-CTERM sorting domain-containing protein [Microcystis aeruginosa CS-558/01A06]